MASKKSPEDLLAELEESTSEQADDSGIGINLFDYLVKSTTKVENRSNADLSFSSVHSSTSTASKRRRRQLRVKRYTEEGEEVNDATDIPESALNHSYEGAASVSSFSSLNASGRSFRSHEGGTGSRSGRLKRYQAQPSPISSRGEDDEELETERSFPSAKNDTIATISSDDEHMDSPALSPELGNSESSPLEQNVASDEDEEPAPTFAQIRAQIAQAMAKPPNLKIDDDVSEADSNVYSVADSQLSSGASSSFDKDQTTLLSNPGMAGTRRGLEPVLSETELQHSRNIGERGSVRVESKREEHEPEEEDVLASSQRARESIRKRQAAALAAAAASRYTERSDRIATKGENTSMIRTTSVRVSDENGAYSNAPKEADETVRAQRRHELEQRKRKLEALAQAASSQRMNKHSSANLSADSSMSRSKSTKQRVVNIDVYTGEVIGEMPKISTLLGTYQTREDDDAASSSSYSSTEYDIPAAKGQGDARMCIVLLVLIGTGLGIYFGLYFNKNEEGGSSGGRSIPSVVETPVPSVAPFSEVSLDMVSTLQPSSLWSPNFQPSLRPSRPSTASPSVGPLGGPSPSSTGQSLPRLADVDQELFELLGEEWPILKGFTGRESSPQVRALQWLSSDDSLASFSTERKKQRFALATFFYSTDGENWTNNDQWLSSTDECLWFTSGRAGLQCNTDGLFTNLEINFNGLNGTIPAELGLLSNSLNTIDLVPIGEGGASIIGTIPSEIGLLSRLELLSLRGNRMQGPIPTEIGNLFELTALNLNGNMFAGQLPSEIGLLTKLNLIDLGGNLIVGTLPSEIGNLVLVESLLLSNNQISGSIPRQLSGLRSVTNISADSNAFTSIPTEIGNLAALSSLSIADNKLGGTIPSEIGKLSSLLRLNLSRNLLSGTIPTVLGNLALLRDNLDLSDNKLSGPIPLEFGRLLLLRQLLLYSNQLTGEIPTSFRSLGSLNKLRVEFNLLSGSVPDSVCAVFNNSFPVFASDCVSDLECPCCSYCCTREGNCVCQFENTPGLEFLCTGFP